MSIVRAPRPSRDYTVVRNDVLRDVRLSYRARGVLMAILSRPDDWRTDAESLAREGREGRDAIRAALLELQEAGYLRRQKRQDPQTGRWSTESMVFDEPDAWKPAAGDPTPGNPTPGNPTVGESGPLLSTDTKYREERNLPATVVAPNAGTIITAWIEGLRVRPPDRVVGQTAREVRLLLDQGYDPALVLEALKSISGKGLHPSTLASELNTILNPPTTMRGGASTADQRLNGLKSLLVGSDRGPA